MERLMINRKVLYFTLFAIVFGMANELLAIFDFPSLTHQSTIVIILQVLSPRAYLGFLNPDRFGFLYQNPDNYLSLNYINLFFYLLLMIGLILYLISKGKETRFIRLVTSVFLLNICFRLVISFLFHIVQWQMWIGKLNTLVLATYYIASVAWVYMFYKIIIILSKNRELDLSGPKIYGSTGPYYVETPAIQRFVHRILDVLFSTLICSITLVTLGSDLIGSIAVHYGEGTAIFMIMIVGTFIYYLFFELLLGNTPAKYLTESRVISKNGEKPSAGYAIIRTFSRFIPFEPISFMMVDNWWHDSFSQTRVVKEKRLGVSASKYLLIIPSLLVIGIIGYSGYETYRSYQREKGNRLSHKLKTEELTRHIIGMNEKNVVELTNLDNFNTWYLKAEEVGEDTIYFAVFKSSLYNPSSSQLEADYLNNQQTHPIVGIDRRILLNSIEREYNAPRKGHTFFNNGTEYEITKIYKIYSPNIEGRYASSGYADSTISFNLANYGWPAEVISIENIEGNLTWEDHLQHRIDGQTYLSAGNFKRGKKYKCKLVVQDTLGNEQRFIIEGLNYKFKLKEDY